MNIIQLLASTFLIQITPLLLIIQVRTCNYRAWATASTCCCGISPGCTQDIKLNPCFYGCLVLISEVFPYSSHCRQFWGHYMHILLTGLWMKFHILRLLSELVSYMFTRLLHMKHGVRWCFGLIVLIRKWEKPEHSITSLDLITILQSDLVFYLGNTLNEMMHGYFCTKTCLERVNHF